MNTLASISAIGLTLGLALGTDLTIAQGTLPKHQDVETVTYQIEFTNLWNANDHASYPADAHYSPIAVIAHDRGFSLFKLGGLASDSFEDLAELGRTAKLDGDVADAADAGKVKAYVKSAALWPLRDGTPSLAFTIKVPKGTELLSLATMIAPSPDWIVGIDSLPLMKNGQMIERYKEALFAINAGTEEGDSAGNFSLDNAPTNPPEPIAVLTGTGYDAPFATVEITLAR
jgi:hypothetical protein